ncbi:hypothetical protein QVD17_31268 [Tagetes erecta]|uniref:Uncharacterized protein n=1 Tax=Tagetes erecta TaxID=13708 RepID=A0AAD8NNZ8_TARER|nr:hypothetical protein QVD17_31268 [Tagetes erecta]
MGITGQSGCTSIDHIFVMKTLTKIAQIHNPNLPTSSQSQLVSSISPPFNPLFITITLLLTIPKNPQFTTS